MRIRPIALSAAALAALGLAACGPGSSSTASSGSSKPSASASSSGDASADAPAGLAGTLQQAYSTTVDSKTAKIAIVIKGSAKGTATTVNGTGSVQFKPLAEDLTMSVAGQQVKAILINGVEYVQVPGSTGWRKVDLSSATGGQADQIGDPTQILSYLQGVSSKVTKTGTTTIRGVQATGYTATVDLDKAAAKQTGSQRDAIKKAEKALGGSTVPVQVWLDSKGRLVREHLATTVTASGTTVTSDTTIDMYDYGTPVSIQAPQQ